MSRADPDQERLLRRLRENAGPRYATPCPIDAAHGPVLRLISGNLHCPHLDHLGQSASHPLGETPATRNLWSPAEIGS